VEEESGHSLIRTGWLGRLTNKTDQPLPALPSATLVYVPKQLDDLLYIHIPYLATSYIPTHTMARQFFDARRLFLSLPKESTVSFIYQHSVPKPPPSPLYKNQTHTQNTIRLNASPRLSTQ
jgi:hypothetical protein